MESNITKSLWKIREKVCDPLLNSWKRGYGPLPFLLTFNDDPPLVFLATLTISQPIAAARPKISKTSYLRKLSTQVSQLVSLAALTVSQPITAVRAKILKNFTSPQAQYPSIANGFLSHFDRF